jgi:hypothetical protein
LPRTETRAIANDVKVLRVREGMKGYNKEIYGSLEAESKNCISLGFLFTGDTSAKFYRGL